MRASAHLDVKVMAFTNTLEEKSRFVAEAMARVRAVLAADFDPVAYIVATSCRATHGAGTA